MKKLKQYQLIEAGLKFFLKFQLPLFTPGSEPELDRGVISGAAADRKRTGSTTLL